MNSKQKKPFENLFYDFVKVTAGIPGLIWFRPKTWYENDRAKARIRGGALLIANHRGALDPIAVHMCVWYRRIRFVCLKLFFERPVAAWFFKRFHCIPVDRENISMDTLRQIVGHLKAEQVVAMFPEGHVVLTQGQTDPFKSGMVLISVMSQKPIIPIYMAPRKHFYSRLHMVLGEPVDIFAQYGPMPSLVQIEQITNDLHQHEERLRAIYENRRNLK